MKKAALSIVLALVAFASAQAQSAHENVSFSSLDPGFTGKLSATLYRPSGAGPFPAMVLLHACGGLVQHEQDWGRWFAQNGYEALVVDSFGPRGVKSVCAGGTPTMRTRAFDAYGALAYLRTRPEVDGNRVGVIGWSHGGGTALIADGKRFVDGAMAGKGFRAAIGLYPVCGALDTNGVVAPLLLLLASDDDWALPGPCERVAADLTQRGFPITSYTYPGASHGWDNPAARGQIHVGTEVHTMIYNAADARDAHDRVLAFLNANLK
jgi:dienelactone hydrolase